MILMTWLNHVGQGRRLVFKRSIIAQFFLLSSAMASWAQDADVLAKFYKEHNLTIAVGSSTGGGLDTYARLVGRWIGRHVPGNPSVIISNMPGAGGNIVANHLYNVAPQDGSIMAITFPSVIVDPLLSGTVRSFDPRKFRYVGNANSEVLVCMARQDAPIKIASDLLSADLVIGATAPGSTTSDFPTFTKGLFDAHYRIVTGYQGSREVTLAVEKNEVQGICGIGWSTLKVQYPDMISGKMFGRVIVQEDSVGHPDLNALKIPKMSDLAKTDDQRAALKMFYAQNGFSRAFILPPTVPQERLDALRKAFDATMVDPDLLADAAKMNIDAFPTKGADVEALVAQMYATPPAIVEKVKAALAQK
jgi:tripartite-type tricarboxylate transporter receptor subunit TctC